MTLLRTAIGALGAALSCACGGDSPPAPPAAPPTPVEVRLQTFDGITGAPVASTGGTGAAAGATVDIAAPGYLARQTIVPADGRVFLWPLTVDEAYVRRIVYETWSFSGVQRLYRWEKRALTITPGMGPPAADLASTGAVTLTESTTPDIEVKVQPGDPRLGSFSGFTSCRVSGYTITRCEVLLRRDSQLDSPLMLHELGHTLGLGHSLREQDVMHPDAVRGTWTNDERTLVTMMYQRRRPGNLPPDDDRTLGTASGRPELISIGGCGAR